MLVFVLMPTGVVAEAGPVGGVTGGMITAGSATISNSAPNNAPNNVSTTITQSSQNVSINWQSFNIPIGQTVQFIQPNSSSVALNRVIGPDPSAIFGSLIANGEVFLVNPNGILFGKGACVNVGGLIASTLSLPDSDFMTGIDRFAGNGKGVVLNQGVINAEGGYVALLGGNVSNQGLISARLGSIVLAAGEAITLDVAGDGLLNVTVNSATANAMVQNGGLIRANGGHVLLTTQAAASLLQSTVNNTGIIEAQSIGTRDGTIRLMAGMASGTANVGGTLDASAQNGAAGVNGGTIETSAAHVNVADNTKISTAAPHGKTGLWLIDPTDFNIGGALSDESGTTLSAALATSNITILSSAGASIGTGNVNVYDALTWTAPTTLTLGAVNDINFNAALTTTTGSLMTNAGHDININGALTATNGNISAMANNNININSAAIVVSDGNLLLSAGNNGSGVGTVTFTTSPKVAITTGAVSVYYNPSSYTVPTNYSSDFTLVTSTLSPYMWVYAAANNKIYDGTATAAMSFVGDPTASGVNAVSLNSGLASFETPGAGMGKAVTYSGYTIGGADAGEFALFAGAGTSSATVIPANLSVTATDVSKIYGQTPTLSGFSSTGLVNSETIGSVTETSTGTVSTAGVAGSAYTLIPINATGGSFAPANYNISYINGALTVTPAPLTVTASDVSKVYGQTPTLSGFSSTGLVNSETIGSITETSIGSAATASVSVSPYVITASNATGGTFAKANYSISYVNGVLTLLPPVVTPTAIPPVIPPAIPPVTPLVTKPAIPPATRPVTPSTGKTEGITTSLPNTNNLPSDNVPTEVQNVTMTVLENGINLPASVLPGTPLISTTIPIASAPADVEPNP